MGTNPPPEALRRLTPRQRQIVMLMGYGARPAEVARELHLSRTTISFHLTRIMRRLGLHSRRELVKHAVLLAASAEDSEPHSPDG